MAAGEPGLPVLTPHVTPPTVIRATSTASQQVTAASALVSGHRPAFLTREQLLALGWALHTVYRLAFR